MKELYLNSNTTYKQVEEFIDLGFYSKNGKRGTKITLNTGEYGMLLFNKIISEKTGNVFTTANITIVPTTLGGPQFVQYNILIEDKELIVKLEHDEELDKYIKDEIDPTTGFPIRSLTLYIKEVE